MFVESLPHPDPLDLISPNRAMLVFGISRARMAELITSGQLPAIESGKGRRKISITILKRILTDNTQSEAA